MKKLLIILSPVIVIIVGITFYFMTKDSERDYPQILKDGTLHIVTNLDPINYYVSDDTISGYNYELFKALQQYTPIQLKITVENSLDNSLEGLKTGKYDVIARNIPVNSDLKNEYNFTNPIAHDRLILVQRKSEYNDGKEVIRNRLDMGNITIHTIKDSPAIFRLKNLSHEIGDTIHIVEDNTYDYMQLSLMVASREIDYTICDYKTAKKISEQIPELDVQTNIGFTHIEAWVLRKNSTALTDSLNNWLEKFGKTKQYQQLIKKYRISNK